MEELKKMMISRGWAVGCISGIERLQTNELKKVINYIKNNDFITSKVFRFRDLLCEIENSYYNNELDCTVKHKNYYNNY